MIVSVYEADHVELNTVLIILLNDRDVYSTFRTENS